MWTPDLRVLDPDGFEYDALAGLLATSELVPRLLLGRARALHRQQQVDQAGAAYEDILRRFPRSIVASEAAYWQAVCRYKGTHEPDDLVGGWARTLHSRYPDSQWRLAQAWTEAPLRG